MDFDNWFYAQAQPLVMTNRITLDDAITAIISTLGSYPEVQMHMIGQKNGFTCIMEIKKSLNEIPATILNSKAASAGPTNHPRVHVVNNQKTPHPQCTYCNGFRHSAKTCWKRLAEEAVKGQSA